MLALETASSSLSLVFSVMLGPVTRQSFVRTLNPRGPVWMRSQDFGLSECPFYITKPPSPPKKNTLSHTTNHLSACTLSPLRFWGQPLDMVWPGIRMGRRGLVWICMHVCPACMKSMHTLWALVRSCMEWEWVREANSGRSGRGGGDLVLLATCPFLTHDIASDFPTSVHILR